MTLNTVKPRSSITRLSPSMVCGTDLLLGLVMTPSDDCVLSSIRLPFESQAQLCPAARAGRCLILVQKCVARQRRTLHPPSGGAAAPRLFDRITVADAPKRDQGVWTATKTREPSRSWRRTRNSPRHPRDRGARSDDSILDLTIAATHIPHGIVSHRAGSTSIGRTRS